MSTPRFFTRVEDAITPLLSSSRDLKEFLSDKTICIEASQHLDEHPVHVAGLLLATNLFARIYPRLCILGPAKVTEACSKLALSINPACEIETSRVQRNATLCWAGQATDDLSVAVNPTGWDVLIDTQESRLNPANALTSLAAGAIGASEVFRSVFAEFLPKPRSRPGPASFSLLAGRQGSVLPQLSDTDIGTVHLVGAGAIGQAFIHALARSPVRGVLHVIDPERITLANLQRYVLALDNDVGEAKVSLAARALEGTLLRVTSMPVYWDLNLPELSDLRTVCTAVDTGALRIAVQAALPWKIYNAWTQPADIGWSRHESFGKEPCLACLYWPTQTRPSYHQLIAAALKEHELRTLAYLTSKVPVDLTLAPLQLPQLAGLPLPPESGGWLQRSLLEDVAVRFDLNPENVQLWKGKQLADLYREGICAGALLRHQGPKLTSEATVPLAHQSALAGVMLATELIVGSSAQLAEYRHPAIDARLDLLAGFPQLSPRPRSRTPNCICSDADFLRRYTTKLSAAT